MRLYKYFISYEVMQREATELKSMFGERAVLLSIIQLRK